MNKTAVYAHDCTACLMIRDQHRWIGEVIWKHPLRVDIKGQTGRLLLFFSFFHTHISWDWTSAALQQETHGMIMVYRNLGLHDYKTHHWKKKKSGF